SLDPAARALLLPGFATLAFDLKDDQTARKYATQSVELVSETASIESQEIVPGEGAEAIHDGYDVLGRIALRSGDLQMARDCLAKAATAPPGPMPVFGPPMRLAQALLDRGEKDAVLEYLEDVKKIWLGSDRQIDSWIAGIRKGRPQRLNGVDTVGP